MPALYTSQVFPGGWEKKLTISPTAGNVITNLSPGVGLRWVIERFRINLVCDATVVDRHLIVVITDGTVTTDSGISGPTAVAGTNTNFVCTKISRIAGIGSGYNDVGNMTMIDAIITGVDQLRIYVGTGVAGDVYQGPVVVREMAVE